MKKIKLSEIAEVTSGQGAPQSSEDFSDSGIPFIRAGSLENLLNGGKEEELELVNAATASKYGLRLYPKNTILFAKSGMSAKIGRVYKLKKPAYVVNHLAAIIPNHEVNPSYLQRWFEKNPPSRLIPNDSYPSIRISDLQELLIDLPEVRKEQNKIADILDKASYLIQKRKETIKLADEFLRSTFLEMFGDPANNSKHYPLLSLNNICNKITDGTHDTPIRLKEGIKFITGKHIRPFMIDYDNSDYVEPEVHKEIYRRCNPEYGDILYTNIGVNLGTAATNTVDYEFSMKNVALLKIDRNQISSRYLEHILNNENMKRKILSKAMVGGAQQFLSLRIINAIEIPVPELEKQNKFSNIVDKVQFLKTKYNQSLSQMENQFNSLMQRAFRGEL